MEAVRIRKQGFSCRMLFEDWGMLAGDCDGKWLQRQEFLLRYRCLTLLARGSFDRGLGYVKSCVTDEVPWLVGNDNTAVLALIFPSKLGLSWFFLSDRRVGEVGSSIEAVNCDQAPRSRSCWSGQQKSWLCRDSDLDYQQGDLWVSDISSLGLVLQWLFQAV